MSLAGIVDRRHVVICCGSGGVGKTTTAAALALAGARRGRRAVVVTIDPARRLANALGLDGLSDTPSTIDPSLWDPDSEAAPGGSLAALMLDTKTTFDRLVARYAPTPVQAERIFDNRFYRNVSGALSGTTEYMAMEQLHELHDAGDFDLIVVDTPPTRNALDFVDAPARLTRLLDNRLFRVMVAPTRASMRLANIALAAFVRALGRMVGSEVVDDVMVFFSAFEGMEEGFRQRARAVLALLGDPATAFVLVAGPGREAVAEAGYFVGRLEESALSVEGLVLNRLHPPFTGTAPEELRRRALEVAGPPRGKGAAARRRLGALYDNLADAAEQARREADELGGLEERVGTAAVGRVPLLVRPVADFAGLAKVGRHLLGAGGRAGPAGVGSTSPP